MVVVLFFLFELSGYTDPKQFLFGINKVFWMLKNIQLHFHIEICPILSIIFIVCVFSLIIVINYLTEPLAWLWTRWKSLVMDLHQSKRMQLH